MVWEKPAYHFDVPRIEPMVDVMRSEENMKVGIVRLQWQLHQQKRQVHRDDRHKDQAHGNRPCGRRG